MLALPPADPIRCLQKQPAQPAEIPRPLPRPEEEQTRGRVVACAFCRNPVTTQAARIEVAGSHEHTFTNPHGFRYHIGCFSTAAGLVAIGEPTTYWTWFPAYSWQIEQCGGCREHLGWLFRSSDHRFHGFILDRLVEVDEA